VGPPPFGNDRCRFQRSGDERSDLGGDTRRNVVEQFAQRARSNQAAKRDEEMYAVAGSDGISTVRRPPRPFK
jgi:hypothetical protein